MTDSANGKKMDPSRRSELIRAGNQAFNEKDYPRARDLFVQASYADGLVRIGDYYMFERRLPLLAYGYYKKAGAKHRVLDLQRRMIGAIGEWVGKDKLKEESIRELGSGSDQKKGATWKTDTDGMVHVPVSPLLKSAALKILEKQ